MSTIVSTRRSAVARETTLPVKWLDDSPPAWTAARSDRARERDAARERRLGARQAAWTAVSLAAVAGAAWLMQGHGFAETCAGVALAAVATVLFLGKVLEAGIF